MILLITYFCPEENKEMVSHGVDLKTDRLVVLPSQPLFYFGDRKWDTALHGWVLHDK